MHETFEHTADLGLRARAPDLDTLFAEMAQALFSAVVDDLTTVEPRRRVDVHLAADDREYLLFDWLRALMAHFETERLLLSRFECHVTDAGLNGSACGEPLDPARHALGHEVKAITYHGLRIKQTADGWLAEVIVDI
jgi:SHS2 domain-containing protein